MGNAAATGATDKHAIERSAPSFSPDGHVMYFSSTRPGGAGGNDIYVSRRSDKRDDFGWEAPTLLGPEVNTAANESSPVVFEDEQSGITTLFFDSNRAGGLGPFTNDGGNNGNDIYAIELSEPLADAQMVPGINTTSADRQPAISRDGLQLYLTSDRPGTLGYLDLWVSTRATVWDLWGEPVNLGPLVNGATSNDAGPALSFDGTSPCFQSIGTVMGSTGFDLYASTRVKKTGPCPD